MKSTFYLIFLFFLSFNSWSDDVKPYFYQSYTNDIESVASELMSNLEYSVGPALEFSGNGVGRGGGDLSSQAFKSYIIEALSIYVNYQKLPSSGLPKIQNVNELVKEVVSKLELNFWDDREVKDENGDYILKIDGVFKDCVTTIEGHRIDCYAPMWNYYKNNPIKKYTFPLHELLWFVQYIDDENYNVSSQLEIMLMHEQNLNRFKEDVKRLFHSIIEHFKIKFENYNKNSFNTSNVIKASSAYDRCVKATRELEGKWFVSRDDKNLSALECYEVLGLLIAYSVSVEQTTKGKMAFKKKQLREIDSLIRTFNLIAKESGFFEGRQKRRANEILEVLRKIRSKISKMSTKASYGSSSQKYFDDINALFGKLPAGRRKEFFNKLSNAFYDDLGKLRDVVIRQNGGAKAHFKKECPSESMGATIICGIENAQKHYDYDFENNKMKLVRDLDLVQRRVDLTIDQFMDNP